MCNYKIILSALVTVVSLTGCSESKEKIKGIREPLVLLQNDLALDKSLKSKSIKVSQVEVIKSWPQAGYNCTNTVPNANLKSKPNEAWVTSVGSGSGGYKQLLVNVIAAKGLAYTMDSIGVISARSIKNGEEKWTFSSSPEGKEDDTLGGGLCYEKGVLYIVTSFSQVIALDAITGREKWRTCISNPSRANPAICGGKLYIITVANEILALNATSGEDLWSYSGMPESSSLLGGGKVAVKGDVVIGALASGEIVALNQFNGMTYWVDALSSAIGFESDAAISDIRARPLVKDDMVVFISHGGRILAQNYQTGERIWQKEIGGMRSPAMMGDFMYMITSHEELACIHLPTGGVKWVKSLPMNEDDKKSRWAGPIIAGGNLILASSDGQIGFFNLKSGKLNNTIKTNSNLLLSPIVVDGTLLLLDDNANLHAWR